MAKRTASQKKTISGFFQLGTYYVIFHNLVKKVSQVQNFFLREQIQFMN